MKIQTKIVFLNLSMIILYAVVAFIAFTLSFSSANKKDLVDSEKFFMEDKVNSIKMIIESFQSQASELAKTESPEMIKKFLGHARFGNAGYLFAYEKKGDDYYFAFHGAKPQLNGTKTDVNVPDVKGKAFRKLLIDAADNGGGVVEYFYENPKTKEVLKKIAYAKKIESLNWYLVTGIYVDEINARLGVLENESHESLKNMIMTLFVITAVLILIIAILAMLFGKALSTPIFNVSEKIDGISTKLQSSSGTMSEISGKLSEISVEQTAAIEETSASLEELTQMIELNSANAQKSQKSFEHIQKLSKESRESMNKLNEAFEGIRTTSQRIESMVSVISEVSSKTKVIDEIVFQTKLLSFNASVEAERAGEHGRGFAVVAQEVGNLAEMSGKAATEISTIVNKSLSESETLLRESKESSEKVIELSSETNRMLNSINETINSVSEETTEVLKATQEQSLGVKQINQALTEIDRAASTSSHTAETASETSQNLNSLSTGLKETIAELVRMVVGKAQS